MDQYQARIDEAQTLLTQLQALQAQNPTDETAKNIELVQKYLKQLRDSGLDWERKLRDLRDQMERMVASNPDAAGFVFRINSSF
jgi:hypothetical protein